MSFVENTWDKVLDFFNHDQFNIAVWGSSLVIIGWFWFLCGIFMIFDLTGKPKWILRYKIQPSENAPLDKGKAWSAVKQALFNQLFVGMPLSLILLAFMQWWGFTWKTEDLPTLRRVLRDFLGAYVVEETVFYYSHRLFHWPPLYKRFHKTHHEWTATIGVVSIYAHPLEHVLCNHSPVILGPALMQAHVMTAWAWYMFVVFMTVIQHCGYHLPFMPSPEFHDFHHLKFHYNYGTLGILDWLHGTDKLFRDMVHSKRHRLLHGLTPMREQYPDKPCKPVTNGTVKID